jgi:hypothetical protein
MRIEQTTDYPFGRDGKVSITVTPKQPARLNVRLRIPGWSTATTVKVNGAAIPGARAGTYLSLDRDWKAGDRVEVQLDMTPRVWPGEHEAAGKVSLYRGPILLAYDPRFDTFAPAEVPAIDWRAGIDLVDRLTPAPRPMFLARAKTRGGDTLTLCDFASAGAAGNDYVSWLPGEAKTVPFTRENPWRLATP